MSYRVLSIAWVACLLFTGCKEDVEFKFNSPKKLKIDSPLSLSVTETNGKVIDSVVFYLDGVKTSTKNPYSVDISNKTLGKHTLSAVVYHEGKSKRRNNSIYFLADKAPILYNYEIVNTYPHDPKAFTQGFEFHNGYLYESTGQKGQSSIRKTALKTGKVLQKQSLDAAYFGEGITIYDGKIYQLTWQSKKGFVYDLESFQRLDSFAYGKSIEGWGLTHNATELIKSDGTERLWFLDPKTQKETHYIEAYTNKRKAERLNEIEYIRGKIYANIWQKNTIVLIDANNGAIEGLVNLNSLAKKVDKVDPTGDYVLNGIAYDSKNDRLFVTGKNWSQTFEIRLLKK